MQSHYLPSKIEKCNSDRQRQKPRQKRHGKLLKYEIVHSVGKKLITRNTIKRNAHASLILRDVSSGRGRETEQEIYKCGLRYEPKRLDTERTQIF